MGGEGTITAAATPYTHTSSAQDTGGGTSVRSGKKETHSPESDSSYNCFPLGWQETVSKGGAGASPEGAWPGWARPVWAGPGPPNFPDFIRFCPSFFPKEFLSLGSDPSGWFGIQGSRAAFVMLKLNASTKIR